LAAGCASGPAPHAEDAAAETRALAFLSREVPAWSRDNGCFSCHNNGDAARALYFASRMRGPVERSALADTTSWVKQPQRWADNKGDPGFSDQRLADLQFAASLLAAVEAGLVRDRRPLQQAARRIAAGQDETGAWPVEPQNAVGSPATWGTALATYMAWRTLRAAPDASAVAIAMGKAREWLAQLAPANVPAAATLLLWSADDGGKDALAGRSEARALLQSAQGSDGGWGPYAQSPSEVFDTALALLALAELPPDPDTRARIRRGRQFLAGAQLPDGSWPATTRPSGGTSYAQQMSTTGWATLALLRTR
jgi:hypothetical protein